jgi:hypothetical protein
LEGKRRDGKLVLLLDQRYISGRKGSRDGRVPHSVKSWIRLPGSCPSEGKAPGLGVEMGEDAEGSWIEQTDHQLLLRGDVEGFLLGGPPEFPHANVAGTKVEIILVLKLSVHATSAATEHHSGAN